MNLPKIKFPRWITKTRPRSINTQLLMYGMVLYIPLLVLLFMLGSQYVRHEEADTIHDALDAARHIDSTTTAYVESLTLTARQLAVSKTIYDDDVPGFDRRVRATPLPEGASVVLIRSDGQQVINTYMPPNSPLPKGISEQIHKVFVTGEPIVSDVLIGLARKEFIIVAAVPIRKDNAITYVLEMVVPVTYFQKILNLLTPQWRSVLTDSHGQIISRWNEQGIGQRVSTWEQVQDMVPGSEKSYDLGSRTIEGRLIRGGVRRLSNGWYVGVTAPPDVFEAPAKMFFRYAGGIIVYFLILPIIAAWFLGRPVRFAVNQLVIKAKALSLGLVVEPEPTAITEINTANRIMYDAAINLKRTSDQKELLVSTLDQELGLPKTS